MTPSTTNSLTKQTLHQRIDRLLDFTPEVKIQKLEYGSIKVNDTVISNRYGCWICDGVSFYRRKSAVGYALCLLRNDTQKANAICKLDQKLQKVKCDIDVYHYHMRKSNPKRQIVMSNRISADMPVLHTVDAQLTSLLKTIQV